MSLRSAGTTGLMKCANQPSLDHYLSEESIGREIGSGCEADHMTKGLQTVTVAVVEDAPDLGRIVAEPPLIGQKISGLFIRMGLSIARCPVQK